MKVVDVRTHVVDFFRTNLVLAEVRTDEGITGVGEATLEHNEMAVSGALEDMAEGLVGRDPLRIRRNYHDLARDVYWGGGAVTMTALSALEMAMWDIAGKALDVPVSRLLGGPYRDRIKVYANGWFSGARTPDDFAAKAKDTVGRGFLALKWDPFGDAYMTMTRSQMDAAVECVGAVRAAVGADVDLLIEAHGRFDVATAVAVAHQLEQFRPGWLEEPIPPDNLAALGEVRANSTVPIAAGERWYGARGFREVIERHLVDVVQPDMCHAGGIHELLFIADAAAAQYIPLAPHNPNGPVATAATLQVAATAPNFRYLEMLSESPPWRQELATEELRFADGYLETPTGPGLGVTVDFAALAAHPYRPRRMRHYTGGLTDVQPSDAVAYF